MIFKYHNHPHQHQHQSPSNNSQRGVHQTLFYSSLSLRGEASWKCKRSSNGIVMLIKRHFKVIPISVPPSVCVSFSRWMALYLRRPTSGVCEVVSVSRGNPLFLYLLRLRGDLRMELTLAVQSYICGFSFCVNGCHCRWWLSSNIITHFYMRGNSCKV